MVSAKRAGFTLLEVVVALTVISLVAVGALATVAQQMRTAARARETARAASLAMEKLAAIPLLNATQLEVLPDTFASGRFPVPDQDYTWRITSTPELNELDLYDALISIEWPTGSYVLRTRYYIPSDSAS